MCDEVIVMYAGRVVEHSDVREIFNRSAHPYTRALLDSVPRLDRRVDRLYAIPGAAAGGYARPQGCSFAPRCALAQPRCHTEKPPLMTVRAGHTSECFRAAEVYAGVAAPVETARAAP
jgi:oligopeptide/dipeptide ABC transporter ATP-binding protein